jgi:hypothetical protein
MTGQFAKLLHPMMSRTVQPVFTPASDAISVAAWLAGQQIELTSRSAGRPDDRALGRVALHSSSGYGVHDIGTNLSNVRSSHAVDRSGPDSFTI